MPYKAIETPKAFKIPSFDPLWYFMQRINETKINVAKISPNIIYMYVSLGLQSIVKSTSGGHKIAIPGFIWPFLYD